MTASGCFRTRRSKTLPDPTELYGAALVSDVMHHLPASYRTDFLSAVHVKLAPGAVMFIKDIEPGHPIAQLSLFCDIYVSRDKGTSLVSMEDLKALTQHLQAQSRQELGLIDSHPPNYLFKLTFGA